MFYPSLPPNPKASRVRFKLIREFYPIRPLSPNTVTEKDHGWRAAWWGWHTTNS